MKMLKVPTLLTSFCNMQARIYVSNITNSYQLLKRDFGA